MIQLQYNLRWCYYAEYEISPNDTTATINDINVELHCQTSSNLDFSIWEIFLDNGTYWTVSASDPERQLSRLVLILPYNYEN